jgi:hypothetical protein
MPPKFVSKRQTHFFYYFLKVIPALRKQAKAQGIAAPVVLMTCDKLQEMCTHYVVSFCW